MWLKSMTHYISQCDTLNIQNDVQCSEIFILHHKQNSLNTLLNTFCMESLTWTTGFNKAVTYDHIITIILLQYDFKNSNYFRILNY